MHFDLVVGESLHRLEQNVDALVVAELTEEGESIALLPRSRGRRLWDGRPPVVLEANPVCRYPPVQVALHQESAGCEEDVDERQMGLDEALAHEELLRRHLGKALVAAPRRFLEAGLLGPDPQQLALAIADRQ